MRVARIVTARRPWRAGGYPNQGRLGVHTVLRASIRDLLRVYAFQGWRLAAGQFVVGIACALVLWLSREALSAAVPLLGQPVDFARLVGAASVALLLVVLLLVPIGVSGYAAIVINTDEALAQKPVRLFRALGRGIRSAWTYSLTLLSAVLLPVALLVLAPVVVVGAVLGLLVTPLVRLLRRRRDGALGWWPEVRTLLIAAIPFAVGVREAARSLLVLPAAVLEKVGTREAFRLAARLVQGRRVRVLALAAATVAVTVGAGLLASWAAGQWWGEQAAQASQLVQVLLLPLTLAGLTAFYRRAAGPDGRALDPSTAPAAPRRRRAVRPVMARVAIVAAVSLVAGIVSPAVPAMAVPSNDGVIHVTSAADTPFDAGAFAAQQASCEADGPDCTVRAALAVAQTLAVAGFGGDLVVRFASDMDVTLAAPDYENGGGDSTLVFNSLANTTPGHSLTIDGDGHSVELIASGSGVLDVQSSRSFVLDGVTVRGGYKSYGGGLSLSTPSGTIVDTTFTGNSAGWDGGAVYSYAPLTVVNSTFSRNEAGFFRTGADIYTMQPLGVLNSTFIDSTRGAPLAANPGSGVALTLVNSILARDPGVGGTMACSGFSGLSTGSGNVVPNGDNTCPGVAFGGSVSGDPVGKIVGALTRVGGALVHPLTSTALLSLGNDCPAVDASGRTRPATGCDPGAAEFDHASTTTLTLGSSTSLQGTYVSLTATVHGTSDRGMYPAGVVEFLADGAPLGVTAPLYGDSDGRSVGTTSAQLPAGVHDITAVFTPASGSAYDSSTSAPVSHEVINPVVLTSSTAASTEGDEITLTVDVQAGTGEVAIRDITDGAPGTPVGAALPVEAGRAELAVDDLPLGDRILVADYLGDAEHAAATSPSITVRVRPQSAVELTVDRTTAAYGAAVELTARVETADGDPVADGGTVEFFLDGTRYLTPIAVVGGLASGTLDYAPIGTRSVTARYSGDPVNGTGTSTASTLTVTPVATSVDSVVVTPSSPQYGQHLTFEVTVAVGEGSTIDPRGTVTVTPEGGAAASATIGADGVRDGTAVVQVVVPGGLAAGAQEFDVDFASEVGGQFQSSASPSVSANIAKAATSTVLTAAPGGAAWGQSVQLTATVTAPGTPSVPSGGTVTFRDEDGDVIGSATLGAGGVATVTVSTATLGLGTQDLTAEYAGTAQFAASAESPAVAYTVTQADTSTSVTAPTAIVFGQALSVLIDVDGGAATPVDGTEVELVEVLAGGATRSLGTVTLTGGQGMLLVQAAGDPAPSLGVGAHRIEARFAGDANFAASVGSAEVTVNAATTTTTMTIDRTTLRYGQSVEVEATVTNVGGAGTGLLPAGEVVFTFGGAEVARVPGTAFGTDGVSTVTASATIPLAYVSTGVLQAHFEPADGWGASESSYLSPVVTVSAATTSVSLALTPAGLGGSVGATATVTVADGGPGLVPTGRVYFMRSGGDWSQGIVLDAAGRASFPVPVPGAGSLGVRAWYVPDALDNRFVAGVPSSSEYAYAQVEISTETPSITVTGWPTGSIPYLQPVDLTVTVTGNGAAPTGQVQLVQPGINVTFGDAANLVPGAGNTSTATLRISDGTTFTPGSRTFAVRYFGGGSYTASESAPSTLTVTAVAPTVTVLTSAVDFMSGVVPALVGNSVVYQARIAVAGNPVPSGLVTFTRDSGTFIGTASVGADGRASITTTPGEDWTGQIVASFSSYDPNVASATGALTHSWIHAPVAVQIADPGTLQVSTERSIAVTVRLSPSWNGATPAAPLTGSVIVSSAGQECTAVLTTSPTTPTLASGFCALIGPATAGTTTITADYLGTGAWAPGTATTAPITVIKGTGQASLGVSGGGDWIGLDTVQLEWRVAGPPADGPAITITRDGDVVCTSTAREGTCDYTFEAGAAATTTTGFTLQYAGDADWNPLTASATGGLRACVPLGAVRADPVAGGTLTPITSPNCGGGTGYIAGTTATWTLAPADDYVFGGIVAGGSPVTRVGDQLSVTASPISSPIAFDVRFTVACVLVEISPDVTVAETPNCGSTTNWRPAATGVNLFANMLAGTQLHATTTNPRTSGADDDFIGWTNGVAEGGDTRATSIEHRVSRDGSNRLTTQYERPCYPLTLPESASVSYTVTSASGCVSTLTGVRGYQGGTDTNVDVRATDPVNYIGAVTAVTDTGRSVGVTTRSTSGSLSTVVFRMSAPTTLTGTATSCVPFSVEASGRSPYTDQPYGSVTLKPAGTCPTRGDGWYTPNSQVRIDATANLIRGMTLYKFVTWTGFPVPRPDYSGQFVSVGTTGGVATAAFADPSRCVPLTIKVVPAGALDVKYSLDGPLGNNGCPDGTYDIAQMAYSPSGVPITVTATTTSKSGANPIIAMAWNTRKWNESRGTSVDASQVMPLEGTSRRIEVYGASTVTVFACERLLADVILRAPNGTEQRIANSAQPEADFVNVSPTPDCPLSGPAAYRVGSEVSLYANADTTGYTFLGWGGAASGTATEADAPLKLDGAANSQAITAKYQVICYRLHSNWANNAAPDPAPNCPGAPASEYRYIGGTVVTLEATSDGSAIFREWKGPVDAADGKFAAVVVNADKEVYSYFSSPSAGEAIRDAFVSLGNDIAVAAKKGVGIAAAVASSFIAGSNPVFAVMSAVSAFGKALDFITDKLGVEGQVLDAILSGTDAVGTAMELLQAPFQCGVEWSASAGSTDYSTPPDTSGSVQTVAANALAGQLRDRATANTQSALAGVIDRFYGAEAAANVQTAQRAAKVGGRLAAVGYAVYQQASSGEWDSSAEAAWTDGSAYNACMARVLSKIPGIPAPPTKNFDYQKMEMIRPGDPRYVP